MSPRLRHSVTNTQTKRSHAKDTSRHTLPARLTPVAAAIATLLIAGGIGVANVANAQPRAFSGAWFAAKGAVQRNVQNQSGPAAGANQGLLNSAARQHAESRQQLARSVQNLGRTASAIAAQQAAQKAAREAAAKEAGVPDGHVQGGLWDRDAAGNLHVWTGAERPVHTQSDGKHNVAIKQTDSKAILNWETFNVGRNTTVQFQQKSTDAVLNRVVGADVAPSQIQGAIKGDGTVMVVNQNGVVFSGSSQVNVRNLVTAAAKITDEQFNKGLYFDANGTQATFTDAAGKVLVERGAQITTHTPTSSTQDGGYVLLLASEVDNAGHITTPKGQTVLAAGDSFYIRKGVGTDGNVNSTTAGNEVSTSRKAGSTSGKVTNTGLIAAATGDITLTGHDVTQAGVVVATTSQAKRGTIHLSTRASDAEGKVTLGKDGVTAILLDESDTTALDNQRDAALKNLDGTTPTNSATGVYDNLSTVTNRRDLSRVEIVSGNTVEFQGESTTLATGGEIVVSAKQRTLVDDAARLDVSGAMGIKVAMDSNNLAINIQGNEMRDAPVNRDSDPQNNRSKISNLDIWLDRRNLIHVPAGTNGYKGDRWYTAGGLLEVSGWLATSGHSVGEWMAQGGTITVTGNDLVTRAGSQINLSGGTLDVQSGYLRQSWLRGADGRLYTVDNAPGDVMFSGLYKGYEQTSERWGQTRSFYNHLLAPTRRYEEGYTVGRDAGKLVVATSNAVLEGDIVSDVYQGARQTQAAEAGLDGYYQSQRAVARRGQLIVGQYTPLYDADAITLRYELTELLDSVKLADVEERIADGLKLNDAVAERRLGKVVLDTASLNEYGLYAVRIAAKESIGVENALRVSPGGEIELHAPRVDVTANLTARSGTIRLGNVLEQPYVTVTTEKTTYGVMDKHLAVPVGEAGGVFVREGVALNTAGLVTDLRTEAASNDVLANVNGGTVSIRSTESVTLEGGSLIDVSSGAVVSANGNVAGGKGGNVKLGAGLFTNAEPGNRKAVLALDGSIRGYGVNGGGKLEIESASAISIGGELLKKNGVLQAGESVSANLILLEDYEVKAGEVLPVDYSYEVFKVEPGQPVTGGTLATDVWYILGADFVLPIPDSSDNTIRVTDEDGRDYRTYSYTDPGSVVVPKGTKIRISSYGDSYFSGYVVEPAVFPEGMQLKTAEVITVPQGNKAPVDFTVTSGSRLEVGTSLARPAVVAATTTLSPSLFQSGFSSYGVRGHNGLVVTDGINLNVAMPVLYANASTLLTDRNFSDLFRIWSPDLYIGTPNVRKVTQRSGASLSLAAGVASRLTENDTLPGLVRDNGSLYIGLGASLRVDPGQSIVLSSRRNLSIDGLLEAKGGNITLLGPQTSLPSRNFSDGANIADGSITERAITLSGDAVLDVSAVSFVAHDLLGRAYGTLTDGGNIVIGGTVQESGSRALASDAFVVIEQGAQVDASGDSAFVDVDGAGSRLIASNGGNISIASGSGVYINGTLRAESGGEAASGGKLTVALEAPNYQSDSVDSAVLAVRELRVVQQLREQWESAEPSTLRYGHAAVAVDQVEHGGFSSLVLYSNGVVSFGADTDLSLGRELRIYSGGLAVADSAPAAMHVSLSAPYILLAGITDNGASTEGYTRPSYQGGISASSPEAKLTANADLIDIKGVVTLGLNASAGGKLIQRQGFGDLALSSSGDIRAVDAQRMPNNGDLLDTQLLSPGNITLRATQIYPATGVLAQVQAGLVAGSSTSSFSYHAGSRLIIERADGAATDPAIPHSVFGHLTLGAGEVLQSGVLRAPLGSITLGTDSQDSKSNTAVVTLSPTSLTSVSAAGLVMPYGGTSDDVTYKYQGSEVSLTGIGNGPTITLSASNVTVHDGAKLDLSGGGDLLGAGFVSGRGGSTDARYHPLVQIGSGSFSLPSLSTNPIYAILPGYAFSHAPADSGGAVDPLIGQQVAIRSGDIPGLEPGVYTLLPSSYALQPGAFRIEVNGSALGEASTSAIRMRNGSFSAAGTLGVANAGIVDSLSSQFIITPSEVLRAYSQYNETSYSEFVLAQSRLNGTVRAGLPADAKALAIRLPSSQDSSFYFDGWANFAPGENGYGGTARVVTSGYIGSGAIEIIKANASPTDGFSGASVHVDDLNAIGASQLTLGGRLYSTYVDTEGSGNQSNYIKFDRNTGQVVLREGVVLRAPEVFLIAANVDNGIAIESGAGINTIGKGSVAYDSTDGYVYRPGDTSVVAASNGWINMLAPVADESPGIGAGPISIGICGASCAGATELYSEGTLLAATLSDFELSEDVRYGTRNLVLAVGSVNAGSNDDLATAASRGALTGGLTLNQTVLDRLLQGDTAYSAPALERLVLTASESFNLFGNVSLDTIDPATGESRLDNLVLTTPAFYGYGDAGDIATITAAKLTWGGVDGAELPAPVVGGRGTGNGALVVNADVIEFGYDASAQPTGISDDARTILGFADVVLNATDRITANQKGSLSVYQSQTLGENGAPRYQGGNLTLTAPLVTGKGGSVNRLTAGGALQVLAPAAGATDAAAVTLAKGVETGAELSLAGASVRIDTTVALPSGKLTVTASEGDVTLDDNARLDLSGRAIQMFDVTRYSWGGDVILRSASGNITQTAGSNIDVSAENNHAGLITATALAEGAGIVALNGTLRGSASGHYDAGGTDVPYRQGSVDIGARSLGGADTLSERFAALNAALNEGGFLGERSFQLKAASDLTIGEGLKAREINVSLDDGRLTVNGTVDASGEQVGSIRLAASKGVTLASGAVLDAHGKVLRVDSYGKIIDSPNRAIVELDAGAGLLTLADNVRIDLRHGTESAGGDGKNRGTLDLYATRLGSGGKGSDADAAMFGDVAIDAKWAVDIQGAKSIAVYGRQAYDDAPYGTDEAASGRPYQVISQAWLNGKHAEAQSFISEALKNADLLETRLAGLNNSKYAEAFHLRPAVEIVSKEADGDLIVSGDLDLSGYRYASLNPNTRKTGIYGSGEVGMLTLRAGGDLSIYGSINDGFARPPETPDDDGSVLTAGVQAFGGDVVVPVPGVTLAEGTVYPKGKTLNYEITVKDVTLPSGTTLPADVTLDRSLTLPAGTVLVADVLAADGTVFMAGTVVGAEGLQLLAGGQLLAGTRLPVAATFANLTWPKGVKLPVAMTQQGSKTLPIGALIASGTNVILSDDMAYVDLRPKDAAGNYIARSNWAVAKMLPAGSQSWAMRLVAGADVDAADRQMTRLDAGNLILADTHYGVRKTTVAGIILNGLNQKGADALVAEYGLPDGFGNGSELVGKTEAEIISLYGGSSWDDFGMPGFWDAAAGNVQTAGLNQKGADALVAEYGLPDGFGNSGELVGKTQAEIVSLYGGSSWDDFGLPEFWNTGSGNIQTGGLTKQGVDVLMAEFGLPDGIGSGSELLGKTESEVVSLYGGSSWDDFGLPGFWDAGSGNSGFSSSSSITVKGTSFSVVRTGTADLDIAAGGNFSMQSPYGVYTAGTQTSLNNAALDATYNRARGLAANGSVLGSNAGDLAAKYEALVSGSSSLYQAWYPDGGGNLRVTVGGDLTGDSWSSSRELPTASSSVGNWLWRQGTGKNDSADYLPSAWWINFGTYTSDPSVDPNSEYRYWPTITGFTGLGTLGGGNIDVRVAGDAGVVNMRSTSTAEISQSARSQGVVLAVGGTGRVLGDGSLVLTGGGDLDVRVGGGWNSHAESRLSTNEGLRTQQTHELYGALVNLRGAIDMSAAQVGTIQLVYGLNSSGTQTNQDSKEIRPSNPYGSSLSMASGGLMVIEGDGSANIASRGDLVFGGTGDAGLVDVPNYVALTTTSGKIEKTKTWFSLWTDSTALNLAASGGNLAFDTRASEATAGSENVKWDYAANGGWFLLPGNVDAIASMGSIYYGTSAAYLNATGYGTAAGGLLAPMGRRAIDLLAGDSVYAGGYLISSSGASVSSIATIDRPAFFGYDDTGENIFSNASQYAPPTDIGLYPLFAFGINTIGDKVGLNEVKKSPSRFYAVDGDIVGLQTGAVVQFPTYGIRAGQTDYVGSIPVAIRAGRDIVNTGGVSSTTSLISDSSSARVSGNLIVHSHANDVSVVEAGRDIYYARFNIAGPGTLEVSAGRSIVQHDKASLTSIGPVVAGDSRPGASILVQAGQTASTTNYAGFLVQYLDTANLAETGVPLADQSCKVVKTYESELVEWLDERYGFSGTVDEAQTYFWALAPEQQRIFARQVYFAELKAGGREFNDAEGPRYGSYLRGRNAIAALFPEKNAAGEAIVYQGDLLIYGDAGIHTNLGGDVHVLTPGGAQTYGVEGPSPGGTAGVITRGEGDIHMYSLGSILLGQSRIMTAAGGDILGWSAEGDINAGRGSKTTLVYAPPRRVYDAFGNVEITPDVPATGAGIATLNRGDVDLIAPLGTIDAGEAGIRVAGNVNVAALHVVNADNIQVQGDAKGVPVVASVNTGALTSASAAASSAASAAQDTVARSRAEARQNLPSIVTVQILGFGDEPISTSSASMTSAQSPRAGQRNVSYQPDSVVRVLGLGDNPSTAQQHLTPEERSRMSL
ncbi:filamentous haemagglutinin family protein [Alcaligenes faecalis]|uniref:filamentous haemagglutinin family protein n=1 Tax=Alcaligenes faecalis TaxID=511 RepID=UPI0024BCBA5E|nr:filamentous haemagglutinin family protein [Alcaligenes faecalis]WHQ43790.1 filamentous hemagglutinin N-terminal domain-containing protein [Alcaligenes faecalis]